jgi:hypothetical protein
MSPAVQTSYTATLQPGLEGQPATMVDDRNTETRTCETAAGIAFGRAVSEGANARGAVIGGATRFLGITMIDKTLVAPAGAAVDVYPRYSNMGVLLEGDIWVRPVAAVTHGAPATYDGTTGQLNPAAAGIAIPNSRYITSASAGALALLRLTGKGPGA